MDAQPIIVSNVVRACDDDRFLQQADHVYEWLELYHFTVVTGHDENGPLLRPIAGIGVNQRNEVHGLANRREIEGNSVARRKIGRANG
jgi:hypothetical protein